MVRLDMRIYFRLQGLAFEDSAKRKQGDADGQNDPRDVTNQPMPSRGRGLLGSVDGLPEAQVLRHVIAHGDERRDNIQRDGNQPQPLKFWLIPIQAGREDQANQSQQEKRHDGVEERRELRPEAVHEDEWIEAHPIGAHGKADKQIAAGESSGGDDGEGVDAAAVGIGWSQVVWLGVLAICSIA